MLTQIAISNYTIVSSLEMEFSGGMTVITGETGAGKSIMLDALGLCLGDRADSRTVRHAATGPKSRRGSTSAPFPRPRPGCASGTCWPVTSACCVAW